MLFAKSSPVALARAYHDHWRAGRFDLAADLLAVTVEIETPINTYARKADFTAALAISRVSFAGLLSVEGDTVMHCATAFGAISDTVIRHCDLDAMLIGLTLAEARERKRDYLAAYEAAIQPTRGRVSAEYRKTVCMNLLNNFLCKFDI